MMDGMKKKLPVNKTLKTAPRIRGAVEIAKLSEA